MRTVLAAALVAWSVAAFAQAGAPGPATTSAAPVITPALERKIREAHASGSWLVEEGEELYTISRYFARDEAEALALARELAALNPEVAIDRGDRLRVGARLRLPPRLAAAPRVSLAPSTLPVKTQSTGTGEARAVVTGPPVYVDQLIGGAQAREEERREEAEPRDASPGLRSLALEYRLDRRTQSFGGLGIAQGIAMRHRRETERFGDFTFEAEAGRESGMLVPGSEGARHVGRATLFHDHFALTSDLVASSALGAVRLGPSPWLASGSRVQLPSTIAAGFTTQVDAQRYQVRAAYGRLARLAGVAIQDLDLLPGSLAMLEATTRWSERWQVGGGAVWLQGAQGVRDHAAATLAAEYGGATLPRFKLHALADDRGRSAFWADGEARWGRLLQRFGAYHLEPEVVFGDGTLPRDSRGAYWRGEMRRPQSTSTFGAELNQTNLERHPDRGGLTSAGVFGNLSLKLDRSTHVGAGASLRDESPRLARGVHRNVGLFTAFGSRQFSWGLTRLDLSLHATRPRGLPAEQTRTASLSHEWPRWQGISASTLFSVSDERFEDRSVRRTTASLALRGPLVDVLNWDVALTLVDVDDPQAAQRNYNAAVGIDWSPARDWVLRLQWLRNQVEPAAPNPFVPFVRENVVQLYARYEETAGTPYPRVAAAGGRSGTGWIEGVVFFDENGDGVRQGNERGAPGVAVTLNSRSVQVTDSSGRYQFGLVGSGEHRLSVAVERVPLPWGLQDESPRPVRVEVRAGTRVDIPLNRIAP